MTATRQDEEGTRCSAVYTVSPVPWPRNTTGVVRALVLQSQSVPFHPCLPVCQAPSAEHTPGCLLTQPSGIYSYNAAFMCVCLPNKSL